MHMTKFFKTFVALLLLLSLAVGLVSCSVAPSKTSFKKAYDAEMEDLIEK